MHAWAERKTCFSSKQEILIDRKCPEEYSSSMEVEQCLSPTPVVTRVLSPASSPTKNTAAVRVSPRNSPTKSPPSPSKGDHSAAQPLRLDTPGVNPSDVVGKTLQRIVRSPRHPMIMLHFGDSTVYQIHVKGYNPHPSFRGVPKALETDSSFQDILSACGNGESSLGLVVADCRFIRLTDKAFEKKDRDDKWDQSHLSLAFKFEGRSGWHCVWATVVEHDDDSQKEVFRSYEDVYLQPLSPLPSSGKSRPSCRLKRGP